MTRKPIQIALNRDGDLHALCDDGTIWIQGTRGWDRVEGIPQEPVEAADDRFCPWPNCSCAVSFPAGTRVTYATMCPNGANPPQSTWPPGGLLGLWAERPSGTLVRIDDEADLLAACGHGWRFIEAASEEEAAFLVRNGDRLSFRHNGAWYSYTPATPF